MKLAVLVSHPIQYHAPFFRELAKRPELDLTVYFCWDFGAGKERLDPGFGQKIKWDTPLLKGYQYEFLKNISPRPGSYWWGQINPGIISKISRKYDAILIYGWASWTNLLALITAFIKGVPVLLRTETPLNQEFLKAGWRRAWKQVILQALFKKIAAFLAIGQENKKFYEFLGVPGKKIFFVPYAVDNEWFIKKHHELRISNYELRRELGIKPDAVVILFVGKFSQKKRPLDLLRAYRHTKGANKALVLVGDGELRPALEHYAESCNLPNVYFAGFQNQSQIPKYYGLADIFVLPSGLGETWGVVVNEAMCFGLAVIVSDVVGCGPDLVRESHNGYIYPLGDVTRLANYLDELIESPAKTKAFGQKSFEIIQGFSCRQGVAGTLKALEYVHSPGRS